MNESQFHRMTPTDLLMLKAKMKCTKCGAAKGDCDCWIQCECGWSYYKDAKNCNNPNH